MSEALPKILIVDDIELNRALLAEIFKDSCSVLEAGDGQKALDLLDQYEGELSAVLLDIVMPGIDGFQVLEEMKHRGLIGKLPVVMITSETSEWVMKKGYDMGAAEIINKPFSPSIVIRRIHNVIEQYMYRSNLERLVDEQTQELKQQTRKLRENSAQMIDTLSTIIEFKNMESSQHIYNIRTITQLLLTELSKEQNQYQISIEEIQNISEAAAMHDIGKIAIPDQILNKPGKLTAEEFAVMKTHCVKGCEILERLSKVQNLAYYDYCYEICRHHHERYDGNGYPDGLLGNETPIWAQTVSLADVYDALTSKRVYKDAFSPDRAVKMILNGECGAFNPLLLDTLIAVLPRLKKGKKQEAAQAEETSGHISLPKGKGTPHERVLHTLELERRKQRIISDVSDELLFDYDAEKDLMLFSRKLAELLGEEREQKQFQKKLPEKKAIQHKEMLEMLEAMGAVTPDSRKLHFEIQLNLKSGLAWYSVEVFPVFDDRRLMPCTRFIGKLSNIEGEIQQDLRQLLGSRMDLLTGLLNADAMRGKGEVQLFNQKDKKLAMCFLDVDHFQKVNESFGRELGDDILRRLADHLKNWTKEGELAARIGGDEFLLLLEDDGVKERVSELQKTLTSQFENIGMTVSMGLSRYPMDGDSYEKLFHKADQALFCAHEAGKGQICFWDQGCEGIPFRTMRSQIEEYDKHLEEMGKALK